MDKPTGGQFGFGGFAFRFVKNAVFQDEKIAILQRSLNNKVFLRISIAIKTEKQTYKSKQRYEVCNVLAITIKLETFQSIYLDLALSSFRF